MSPLIRAALSSYRSSLEARFGSRLRRVCLFGSWARGAATEDSDVDIAVVVDDLSQQEWSDAVRLAADLEVSTGLPISPFVVSSERFASLVRSGGIGAEIVRDGVIA